MIFEPILRIIAPHICLVCGLERRLICDGCLSKVVVTKTATCYRCNRISSGGKTCASCRSSSSLAGVIVASHYEAAIKQLIALLKYERVRAAAPILAGFITPLVDRGKFDLVTSVPVATDRYRLRGYNQAELIAKRVACELTLPYQSLILRTRNVQQVGRRRSDRLIQIKGAFAAKQNASGKRILIIDDVLTTGATLNECAKVLRQAGAKTVWGAVAAKH